MSSRLLAARTECRPTLAALPRSPHGRYSGMAEQDSGEADIPPDAHGLLTGPLLTRQHRSRYGKGARLDRLPMPVEVGEAIAAFLRRGRPRSDRREVFLRARAPIKPIATGTVGSTGRRAYRRAGIDEVGPRRLRHTLAYSNRLPPIRVRSRRGGSRMRQ